MSAPILPGATIGVLGGGQLGRMFSLAARNLGYHVNVFAPEDDTPAGQIAYREVRAPYGDLDAVQRFAEGVEVVTFEFENVPTETVEVAERFAPVRPAGALLHMTQNRVREKTGLLRHGLPVSPFAVIRSPADLESAAAQIGFPAVLKTAAWGYDGKGQRRVDDAAALRAAYMRLGGARAVLERFVPFVGELSVVGARGLDGAVALYEPVWNEHRDHILDITLCPAPIADAVRSDALELARTVLEAFDVVGVLCVELFLLEDGSLIVNELAPRPHNSGHVTIDAHVCSQFEQQVRAVCGLPLGSTARRVRAAAMANLLGDLWREGDPCFADALKDPGVRLHLYAKSGPRPGRKMGHLTVAGQTIEEARERALAARTSAACRCEEPSWTSS
ncbi:MAG: 5-(carboxyamino)imidazole ribonucleotide synthase [Planctomycetota bacterium]|nr:5-(carboxyamino)imidazole ribonucleotide synthase [Planctomycetota bacterium]